MATDKNPLDEYLEEKQAAGFLSGLGGGIQRGLGAAIPSGHALPHEVFSGAAFGRTIGSAVGRGAMAAAGAAAIGLAGAGAQKLYDAATKNRDFKRMLDLNPDLAERHQENPRMFNQMFSTLRTFNPSFSRDPLVAGTYMRQMSEDPMHAGGKVVETLTYRDKMGPPTSEGIMRAALGGNRRRPEQ